MTVTLPPGADHQITYKFTDIFAFRTLAELPLKESSFSLVANGSGPWQGTLSVESKEMREVDWRKATEPWKTAMWVDIDGALIYGGPVTGRKYQESAGKVSLSGSDFCTYLSQRVQALDYSAYIDPEGHDWLNVGAPVLSLAKYVLSQALAVAHSIPIAVVPEGVLPSSEYWITYKAPITQQQTLASILTQLQMLGYLVGVDYAADVTYAGGLPSVQLTLSYPRRGSTVNLPTIELDGNLDMDYDEDGTQQANRVIEQTGASAGPQDSESWAPATNEDGYPLLEKVVSHASLSPTPDSAAILQAFVKGDLATYTYPLLAPVISMPLFGTPSIFDLTPIGNDAMLKIPTGSGALPLNNPRFPNGLEYRFRPVRADVSIPDKGVPTMAVTLNIPPGTLPPFPPA